MVVLSFSEHHQATHTAETIGAAVIVFCRDRALSRHASSWIAHTLNLDLGLFGGDGTPDGCPRRLCVDQEQNEAR
jgi:hypothetical protein